MLVLYFLIAIFERHTSPQHKSMDLTTAATPLTNMVQTLSVEHMDSSRKYTTTTAWPSHRSAHTIQRSTFRLQDLPPEIRNIVYALAMEEGKELRLVRGLTGTAKALSQVSRSIRADATRIFFSENSFVVIVGIAIGPEGYKADLLRVGKWAETWSPLALPYIRSLKLTCGGFRECKRQISVKLRDTVNPITYPDSGCILSTRIREPDLGKIALAVFGGHAGQKLTYKRLIIFLTAVQDVVAERMEVSKAIRVAGIISRYE